MTTKQDQSARIAELEAENLCLQAKLTEAINIITMVMGRDLHWASQYESLRAKTEPQEAVPE